MMERDNRNVYSFSSSFVKLAVSMLIFGTIGIFRRQIPASSGYLAFSRGLLGALILLLYLKMRRKSSRRAIPGKTVALLLLSGAAIGINWILLFEAYRYTTIAVATLCYYMQPTIVILTSPLFFRERLIGRKLVCVALSVLGMALLSGVIGGTGGGAGTDPRGILYGLGAAALYASVIIMNKKLPPLDASRKTMIQLFAAAMVMIPYLLITRNTGLEKMTAAGWLLLLVVGIIHTGIAYVLYFGSMDLPAQTVAACSYIDPVSALFFSWILLHESLSGPGILGAILILGSAFISERST